MSKLVSKRIAVVLSSDIFGSTREFIRNTGRWRVINGFMQVEMVFKETSYGYTKVTSEVKTGYVSEDSISFSEIEEWECESLHAQKTAKDIYKTR